MWYNVPVTESLFVVSFMLGALLANLGWFVFYRRKMEQTFQNTVQKSPIYVTDWADLANGSSGDYELEKAWLHKFQEMFVLFCKKQHDYGPTNIAIGGMQGVVIRMGDKMSRLWTLTGLSGEKDGNAVSSETIRDTLFDMADYGIIGLMVHDKDWPKIHPSDVWGSQARK